MNKEELWSKNFIYMSVSSFFLFITFYSLLVTLPIYALQHLHAHESEAGLIITVFLIAAVVIRPLAGKWLEAFGSRMVLLSALFIFGAGAVFYLAVQSMTGLLFLRFFHGLGFGMATTAAGTIIANMIPDARKGEGMGYYAMAMNLAMVIGPFLGLTVMQQWSMKAAIFISIFFALCSFFVGMLIKLPKSKQMDERAEKERQAEKGLRSLFEPSAVRISLVVAFFAFGYAAILSFISVYAEEIGLVEVASYFFVVYAAALLLSRPFTGKWFDRYGANRIIYPAIVFFAVGLLLLSKADTAFLFLSSAFLIGLGWGTLFPSFQTIAIQKTAPNRRGLATATFLSIFDLGISAGSFLVGVVGAQVGFRSLYFYSALLVAMGIALYYMLYGHYSALPREKKQEAV